MDFKKLINQFATLDKNNAGGWPVLPKVVCAVSIFAATLTAGYFLDTQSQLDELAAGEAREEVLKKEYVDQYMQAVNLELYKKQLKEVEEVFGALLKQLPDRSKMESLITDINQAGVSQGLAFELFKPAASETLQAFYAELPIAIKVQGTYHQLGMFAGDMSNLSRIVTLNDMHITVGKDGVLNMDATAKTFRYLDAQEMADSKKSALTERK